MPWSESDSPEVTQSQVAELSGRVQASPILLRVRGALSQCFAVHHCVGRTGQMAPPFSDRATRDEEKGTILYFAWTEVP